MSFQISKEACFTSGPAGALLWAGLVNTYFRIDRGNNIGGLWMSEPPFADEVRVALLYSMETAVYDSIANKA